MPSDFKRLPFGKLFKDVRSTARVVVGSLLVLNVAAALFVFRPWEGSLEDLRREVVSLEQQVRQRQDLLQRTRTLTGKIEKARAEGDRFMDQYMLNRRTAYSTIVGELDRIGVESGVKPKESQFAVEPIAGSNDSLGMMTITANFEGAYSSLTKLINLIDRSPKFLIIESVQAAPQPSGATVNLTMKLHAFVRGAPGEIE
jgi:hypothetical protein